MLPPMNCCITRLDGNFTFSKIWYQAIYLLNNTPEYQCENVLASAQIKLEEADSPEHLSKCVNFIVITNRIHVSRRLVLLAVHVCSAEGTAWQRLLTLSGTWEEEGGTEERVQGRKKVPVLASHLSAFQKENPARRQQNDGWEFLRFHKYLLWDAGFLD